MQYNGAFQSEHQHHCKRKLFNSTMRWVNIKQSSFLGLSLLLWTCPGASAGPFDVTTYALRAGGEREARGGTSVIYACNAGKEAGPCVDNPVLCTSQGGRFVGYCFFEGKYEGVCCIGLNPANATLTTKPPAVHDDSSSPAPPTLSTQTFPPATMTTQSLPPSSTMPTQTMPPAPTMTSDTMPPAPTMTTQTMPPATMTTQSMPPSSTLSTQTMPPAPTMTSDTFPPQPTMTTQTMPPSSSLSTQTMPPAPTQTMPPSSTLSTQTMPPAPTMTTQTQTLPSETPPQTPAPPNPPTPPQTPAPPTPPTPPTPPSQPPPPSPPGGVHDDSTTSAPPHPPSLSTQTFPPATMTTQSLPPSSTMPTQTMPPAPTMTSDTMPPAPTMTTQTMPPATMTTQSMPPSSTMPTQTMPPAPTMTSDTMPPAPTMTTQTMPPSSSLSTQTMPPAPTQTLPPSSTLSTQTMPPAPTMTTQTQTLPSETPPQTPAPPTQPQPPETPTPPTPPTPPPPPTQPPPPAPPGVVSTTPHPPHFDNSSSSSTHHTLPGFPTQTIPSMSTPTSTQSLPNMTMTPPKFPTTSTTESSTSEASSESPPPSEESTLPSFDVPGGPTGCGHITAEVQSFFENPAYPSLDTESDVYEYSVMPQEGYCALRIAFIEAILASKGMEGCSTDSVVIVNSVDNPTTPLCGLLQGYQLTVKFEPEQPIKIAITAQSQAHLWKINLTQIQCDSIKPYQEYEAPECGIKNPKQPPPGISIHHNKEEPKVIHPLKLLKSKRKGLRDIMSAPSLAPSKLLQSAVLNRETNIKIVRGNETGVNEYPWQALLMIYGRPLCGASILNEEWLVTAGHCVQLNLRYPLQSVLTVNLGDHDLLSSKETRNVVSKVEKIVPNAQNEGVRNDIALIKLAQKINFGKTIRPVCLPQPKSPPDTYAGQTAITTGWGRTEDAVISPVLREAQLPIISNEKCRQQWSSVGEGAGNIIESGMVCVGGGDVGPCNGDSGGPLVIHDEAEDKWRLVGLTSFGILRGCAVPGVPSVYARLSSYLDWIAVNLAE